MPCGLRSAPPLGSVASLLRSIIGRALRLPSACRSVASRRGYAVRTLPSLFSAPSRFGRSPGRLVPRPSLVSVAPLARRGLASRRALSSSPSARRPWFVRLAAFPPRAPLPFGSPSALSPALGLSAFVAPLVLVGGRGCGLPFVRRSAAPAPLARARSALPSVALVAVLLAPRAPRARLSPTPCGRCPCAPLLAPRSLWSLPSASPLGALARGALAFGSRPRARAPIRPPPGRLGGGRGGGAVVSWVRLLAEGRLFLRRAAARALFGRPFPPLLSPFAFRPPPPSPLGAGARVAAHALCLPRV